ncbi:MAG: hypothetical protein C0466_07795 [Candidatus Accumulibacter sp.]|nr:hypothetical protein [Accumulibacter sp.]
MIRYRVGAGCISAGGGFGQLGKPDGGVSRGGCCSGVAQALNRQASETSEIVLVGIIDLSGEFGAGALDRARLGFGVAFGGGYIEITLHDLQAQVRDFGRVTLAVRPPADAEAEAG